MSWGNNVQTSVHGRRVGLQRLTTSEDARGNEVMVGPEAFRGYATTADTTSTNLAPYGVSFLTTVSSSCVFTLDPPMAGLTKTLVYATTAAAAIYVKTANDETIETTQGTSHTTLTSSQTNHGAVQLVGVTTARWVALGSVSSGFLRASTST